MIRVLDHGEWMQLETATARTMDMVFDPEIAKYHTSRIVASLRECREEAFQSPTDNFIPQSGPFRKNAFAAWATVKSTPNVARWCRYYMGVAPALRLFQMKILSLPRPGTGQRSI